LLVVLVVVVVAATTGRFLCGVPELLLVVVRGVRVAVVMVEANSSVSLGFGAKGEFKMLGSTAAGKMGAGFPDGGAGHVLSRVRSELLESQCLWIFASVGEGPGKKDSSCCGIGWRDSEISDATRPSTILYIAVLVGANGVRDADAFSSMPAE
jgi:hypothetical protein